MISFANHALGVGNWKLSYMIRLICFVFGAGEGEWRAHGPQHRTTGSVDRRELVLATLATAGEYATFLPVQVQKIFFLIDRTAAHLVEGPHFRFTPYDYGPFDSAVYDVLDSLNANRLVEIDSSTRYRRYYLNAAGFASGQEALSRLPGPTQQFLRDTVQWVRSLRFDQLVAAIYRDYPDMKVNSIFRS